MSIIDRFIRYAQSEWKIVDKNKFTELDRVWERNSQFGIHYIFREDINLPWRTGFVPNSRDSHLIYPKLISALPFLTFNEAKDFIDKRIEEAKLNKQKEFQEQFPHLKKLTFRKEQQGNPYHKILT